MDRAGDQPRSELSLRDPWITLQSIWDNLPILLVGAAVFSVFCLPFVFLILFDWIFAAAVAGILTVGPAWAGLLFFEKQLLQNNPGGIANFFLGLKKYWRQGALLGLLAGIPAYANFFLLAWLESPNAPEIAWGGVFALTWVLAAIASLFIYAFPLVILYQQGILLALRNAAVLSSRHILILSACWAWQSYLFLLDLLSHPGCFSFYQPSLECS